MARQVSYFYDPTISSFNYGAHHVMRPVRLALTDSLVRGYGMYDRMDVVNPSEATLDELSMFHSLDYLQFLRDVNTMNVRSKGRVKSLSRYGLSIRGGDCPVFNGLFHFCQRYTGGTIGAVKALAEKGVGVAVNWSGGFHHARESSSSGFCYVNDAVIGIKGLLQHYPRALYIDVDIHHGDSVEAAFCTDNRLMSVSFHRYGANFFPGTGSIREIGEGDGRFYAVNVPLKTGISDHNYVSLFKEIIDKVIQHYQPLVIMYQSGADSVAGDPVGSFNLSIKGHGECLRHVKSKNLPMIVLGGGGYNVGNSARCWAYETAVLLGIEDELASGDIPMSAVKEFPSGFKAPHALHPATIGLDDANSAKYLTLVRESVFENLRMLEMAPSVQLHSPPLGSSASSPLVYAGGQYLQELEDLLATDMEERMERFHFMPQSRGASQEDG